MDRSEKILLFTIYFGIISMTGIALYAAATQTIAPVPAHSKSISLPGERQCRHLYRQNTHEQWAECMGVPYVETD